MKVLEEAAASAKKMSCHNEADDKVAALKVGKIYILYLDLKIYNLRNRG